MFHSSVLFGARQVVYGIEVVINSKVKPNKKVKDTKTELGE